MPAILNDLLLLGLATAVGGFVGYLYHSSYSSDTASRSATQPEPEPEPKPSAVDQSREFLQSLQQTSQAIATGVGFHGKQVQ